MATEPVWIWSGENRADFWARLQAHETAIHRTDAQSAFGSPEPVEAALARDAIDGLLTWFVPRGRAMSLLPCSGKTLRFDESGGHGRWQLRIDDAQAVLEPPTEQFDAIVRGGATAYSLSTIESALQAGKDPDGSTRLIEHVNSEANIITTLICHADGRRPRSVCGRAVIRQMLRHVK